MQIHHAGSAVHLVELLLAAWSGEREDPFAFDLAVVPGTGFQRWLSQRLAVAGGSEGICAGIEFSAEAEVRRRLAGDDDPWQPDRLAWSVQAQLLAPTVEPVLEPVRRHLLAAHEPWTASRRIAAHLHGYLVHRRSMLAAWARGEEVGPDGEPLAEDLWQARLWRQLADTLGDPLSARDEVLAGLREHACDALPHRVAVLAPPRLSRSDLELYEALGTHHQVDLMLLAPSRRRPLAGPADLRRSEFRRPAGHPLNAALGQVSDELLLLAPSEPAELEPSPDTLLGWLQADLRADRLPLQRPLRADDRSFQVHLSHGDDRQVEVLREVVTGLLAGDGTLQPRDIVVITPEVDRVAALITATFGNRLHPAHTFRVQVADRSLAQVNPMVVLLGELLDLADGRFAATRVLQLCTHPAVGRRFGFTADNRDRLASLVEQSGVRWGLSGVQRAGYGLEAFPQNTWFAGVQRLLLGVTLSERDLVTAGTVLPFDDLDSSDLPLVGALAELVGRLSRLVGEAAVPASLATWAQRCRDALAALVSLPPEDEWQLSELWAGLGRLAARDPAGAAHTRHAFATAVAAEFAGRPSRGAFGNGSLIVCGPRSLRHVPHRIVVLLGWDADSYPRPARRHGDDLLGVEPLVGDPSAALEDRQALLDALHAARDRLIVIARGRSAATNEEVPLAAPLVDLLEAVDRTAAVTTGTAGEAVTVRHPLQPFSPAYFDGSTAGLASADQLSLGAARELTAPPRPVASRYRLVGLPPPELSAGVTLDDLTGFFSYPVRSLLRARAGLTGRDDEPAADDIPIEANGLDRWQLSNRMLQRLRQGFPAADIERAEHLRGTAPPYELGASLLGGLMATARGLAAELPGEDPQMLDLSVTVEVAGHGPVPLVGRVGVHGDQMLQPETSRLQPRHRLVAWLRLLALAAARPGPWRATVLASDERVAYQAPPRAEAARLLGRYLGLYAAGLTRALPAPPRLGATWAGLRASGIDPGARTARTMLTKAWEEDLRSERVLDRFFTYPDVLDEVPPGELGSVLDSTDETTLVGSLAVTIWAPALAWAEA